MKNKIKESKNVLSPKVSVIIPCYNQGKYLDEAVNSVLEQTFQDFEIVIINDGSTDRDTIEIIKKYDKPKTRVINTDNMGLASARNHGIDKALGKYILPLDADDKIGPEYLEMAVRVLDENADIGIVYCEAVYFGNRDGLMILPKYSKEKILQRNIIFCSAMFRKKQWEEVGGYNINMVYGWEDWDFWLSLIELGVKVYRIPKVLFHYRIREDSMVERLDDDEKQFFMFLHAHINHKKLFRHCADIHFNHKVSQLYIDTGMGYYLNKPISEVVFGDEKHIEFDLHEYNNIRSIRFDPINDYCVMNLSSIIIFRSNGTSTILSKYYTNATHQKNSHLLFCTNKPQIFLDVIEESIEKIVFNLDYISIGKNSFDYLLNHLNTALIEIKDRNNEMRDRNKKKEKEIQDKCEVIQFNTKKIKELEKELNDKKDELNQILNSTSWKLSSFLRYSRRAVNYIKNLLKISVGRFNRSYSILKNSNLFDQSFYSTQSMEDINASGNSIIHYIQKGYKEGFNPNQLFDSAYYLAQNPDVVQEGINPLVHYITIGAKEGRNPCSLFNTTYYLNQNPDVRKSNINPLSHFLQGGAEEGRNPNPLFDSAYYLAQNPDVAEQGINPLVHYIYKGAKEGRNPSPLFDTAYYIEQYPDLADSDEIPLVHYFQIGIKDGISPSPLFSQSFYSEQIGNISLKGG